MASHLAKIHGTEEDKVNCPFYYKIGACRHGDRCSRIHHKPAFSQTLLVKHLYQNPTRLAEQQQQQQLLGQAPLQQQAHGGAFDDDKTMEEYLCFFEDLYMEFSKFGRVEELHIVENLGDHMIGHVYVKFADEEQASDALQVMNGRYYDGRHLEVEFSPVTDFREARCRDYDEESCKRGGFCNFLHCKPVPAALVRSLEEDSEADRRRHKLEEEEEEERKRRKKKRKKEHKRSSSSRHHHSSSSSLHHRHHGRSGSHDSRGGSSGEGGDSDHHDHDDVDEDDNRRERRRARRTSPEKATTN